MYVSESCHRNNRITSSAKSKTTCFNVMRWLRIVGSLKLQVSSAKEPYKRDYILQKRPIILRSLLIVATPNADMHQIKARRFQFAVRFLIDRGVCVQV